MTKKGKKDKQPTKQKEIKEVEVKETDTTNDNEGDLNSGFSSYLQSSSGTETLRLFVIVNSLVMFLTIAWPQMKSVFSMIEEFYTEKFGSIELF
ncbi:unnamed protein product [Diamesa serratosioi]